MIEIAVREPIRVLKDGNTYSVITLYGQKIASGMTMDKAYEVCGTLMMNGTHRMANLQDLGIPVPSLN